jgi:hypothetical protein
MSGVMFLGCLHPIRSFKRTGQPDPPDYSSEKYWAALPDKLDSADFQLKKYGVIDGQKNAKADVFFIAPTNYLSGMKWNVSVDDSMANATTDNIACKLLASVFNGSCKVYAPRYRSAILYSYFAPNKKNTKAAFNLAYDDVKKAFLYYLKNYNHGRPIVIASHSQGTDYGVRLVKEFFDKDTILRKQLVEAYLIGRPIYDTTFKLIKPSDSPKSTGGFVTWNTVSYNTNSFYGEPVGDIIGINPLSWKRDTVYFPVTYNKGSLPFTADRLDMTVADAKVALSGFLWVHKPDRTEEEYPGTNSFYYHKEDYAFFYMNIRDNVKERVEEFLKKNKNN